MILQLNNINFTFGGGKNLLDNVSLTCDGEKIYALVGGNGSGKTTLFNIITGFHKPRSGQILFKTQDISGLSPYKINRIGVGRTFQDLRLVPKLSVRENVLLAMRNNPTDNWVKALLPRSVFKNDLRRLESRAEEILTDYFLHDVQHSPAREISFGQQKLLNLACCVANGAELLLLDEPAAGISPVYKERMQALLGELKQRGKTIVMIEHNLDFITETAEHFLLLAGGRIFEYRSLTELTASEMITDAYI